MTGYDQGIPGCLPPGATPDEENEYVGRYATAAVRHLRGGDGTTEAFVRATNPAYQVKWFHRAIMRRLDLWLRTPNDRLILAMPPGFGKSELVSRRLPALALGLYPDWWWMNWSHTYDLAVEMGRDVQRVMDAPTYRAMYPETQLPQPGGPGFKKSKRKDTYFELVGKPGRYRGAGVGGGIAGRRFHAAGIDDPTRTIEDAMSATMREKVWQEYAGGFMARQFPGARVLLVQTRFHPDDLAGRLLKMAKNTPGAESWDEMSFPSIK